MDPLGFGFENYDAIGALARTRRKFPIDPSGNSPPGRPSGAGGAEGDPQGEGKRLRACLAEKMLTYALGRGLEGPDRCVVDQIVDAMVETDTILEPGARDHQGDPF
ncbi:MAG: DUF1585 domain-containing protein [Singulisphaera sp.]